MSKLVPGNRPAVSPVTTLVTKIAPVLRVMVLVAVICTGVPSSGVVNVADRPFWITATVPVNTTPSQL